MFVWQTVNSHIIRILYTFLYIDIIYYIIKYMLVIKYLASIVSNIALYSVYYNVKL